MTSDPRSLEEMQDAAVHLLSGYPDTPAPDRTPILRNLARIFVTARPKFLNDNSEPDLKGLTYAYRQWVAETYDRAHITRDDRATIQAAVRYHSGIVLREELDEGTLKELGLMTTSPKARSNARRASRTALLRALEGGNLRQGDLLALSVVHSMLANVTGDDFASLSDADGTVVDNSLAEIVRRAQALRGRLNGGSKRRQGPNPDDGPDYTADE